MSLEKSQLEQILYEKYQDYVYDVKKITKKTIDNFKKDRFLLTEKTTKYKA